MEGKQGTKRQRHWDKGKRETGERRQRREKEKEIYTHKMKKEEDTSNCSSRPAWVGACASHSRGSWSTLECWGSDPRDIASRGWSPTGLPWFFPVPDKTFRTLRCQKIKCRNAKCKDSCKKKIEPFSFPFPLKNKTIVLAFEEKGLEVLNVWILALCNFAEEHGVLGMLLRGRTVRLRDWIWGLPGADTAQIMAFSTHHLVVFGLASLRSSPFPEQVSLLFT